MRTVRELQIEAGQWNEYHNGKPINAGCKVDCKTAEYGYPSMTLQEVATAYHDKGQPGFRAEFDGARNLLQVMLPKFPSIFPSSEVKFEQTNYVEQSYEVGFMTESDVARLLGYSPKDLKMGKGASLKLEDGSGRIQGWFCSLAGMSPEAAGSIRKIKVGSVISVKRDDVLMSKDTTANRAGGWSHANGFAAVHGEPLLSREMHWPIPLGKLCLFAWEGRALERGMVHERERERNWEQVSSADLDLQWYILHGHGLQYLQFKIGLQYHQI